MRLLRRCVYVVLALVQSDAVLAQSLDQGVRDLAEQLGRSLLTQGFKNVAAIDFTNLQGQPTELGRYLAERLSIEVVGTKHVSVVDRANLRSILAEHQLTQEGLINPANAKKLGEFAGVDAILTGTLTLIGETWELLVKAISTESATIAAAGRMTFARTADNSSAGHLTVTQETSTAVRPMASAPGATSPAPGGGLTIASHDLGAVRVVLKSAGRFQGGTQRRVIRGLRLTIEFHNRDTQRTVHLAMNAKGYKEDLPRNAAGYDAGSQMGDTLRTTLLDDRGVVWSLPITGLRGISAVGVGQVGKYEAAHSTAIASLLARRDATGSDQAKVEFAPFNSVTFVFGSTTSLGPGQSIMTTWDFEEGSTQPSQSAAAEFFQLVAEIVVGTETTRGQKSYVLHNVVFDRLRLP